MARCVKRRMQSEQHGAEQSVDAACKRQLRKAQMKKQRKYKKGGAGGTKLEAQTDRQTAVSLSQSSLPEKIPNLFHLIGEIQFSDRDLTIQGDFLNTLNEMLGNI